MFVPVDLHWNAKYWAMSTLTIPWTGENMALASNVFTCSWSPLSILFSVYCYRSDLETFLSYAIKDME
jgi:hypothetical protein